MTSKNKKQQIRIEHKISRTICRSNSVAVIISIIHKELLKNYKTAKKNEFFLG